MAHSQSIERLAQTYASVFVCPWWGCGVVGCCACCRHGLGGWGCHTCPTPTCEGHLVDPTCKRSFTVQL